MLCLQIILNVHKPPSFLSLSCYTRLMGMTGQGSDGYFGCDLKAKAIPKDKALSTTEL